MEPVNNQPNIVRSHDSFYLGVDPLAPPKDSFVQVGNLIGDYLNDTSEVAKIIDIGSATGAFLNYLSLRFPKHSILGYEYLETLIKVGELNYPGIQITQGSILDSEIIAPHSVNVITVLGVISIFDDIEPIVKNLALWIKPGLWAERLWACCAIRFIGERSSRVNEQILHPFRWDSRLLK